jgi:hypothetical protein
MHYETTPQQMIFEGFNFGRRLREHRAPVLDWRDNVAEWSDGPGHIYKNHALRTYFARGFEAGFHGLAKPSGTPPTTLADVRPPTFGPH